MTYLLDISTLVAWLVPAHAHNERVRQWVAGKKLAICPLTELGFLRVAINAYHAKPEDARASLKTFKEVIQPQFLPADISALDGEPFPSARKSTDWYLANLAAKHGMKWGTLDVDARHPAAVLVA